MYLGMMKAKILALTVFMGILSASVSAQPLIMLLVGDKIASEDFVGGIIGGINLTQLSNVPGSTNQLSWSFGASLHCMLSEEWHFCPEVYFKSPGGADGMSGLWGAQPSIDSNLTNREEWTSTSYVAIPLIMKYRLDRFYLFAGPQISYLVAATDNISGTGPEGASITSEKLAFWRMNRWDAGVVGGAEILLVPEYGIHSLRLGVRYYQGFVDVTSTDDVNVTNSGFSVSIGIPIGGQPE
ncbi:MAG: PorT family protein [Ignavibacteriae bacterium]|nr:MAG: PorT family protein [Ignavibacteriota bacterium]